MKLGEKILEYRKKLGLSQEALGEKVGVSRQTVSKWEIGQTIPELEKIILLAKEFGTTIDELVKDENEIEETLETLSEEKKQNYNFNINKYIKLVNWILVIIISFIGILGGIILYRYLMVNEFKNKFSEVGMEKIDENGIMRGLENYRIAETVWVDEYGMVMSTDEKTYYRLGNKYKKLYGNYMDPDRIEYLDYSTKEYYDIDCRNKTYKKININDLPLEPHIQITDKENMIKTEILANLKLWTKKGTLEIATNFDYNIDLIGGDYFIDNYKYYEDFISANVSKWGLGFHKYNYEDKIKIITTRYLIDYGVVNENLVRLPVLTEYTLVE